MTECKKIKPEPPYFSTPEELRGYKEGIVNQLEQQVERLKENTKSNKKAFDKLNSKYSHVCNERDAMQKKLNGKYINVKANLSNVMAILAVSMLVGVGLTVGVMGSYGWISLLARLF